MKILLVISFSFFFFDISAQENQIKTINDTTWVNILDEERVIFSLQFIDTVNNSIQKTIFKKEYAYNPWLIGKEEKIRYLKRSATYISMGGDMTKSWKLREQIGIWNSIYDVIQIEKINEKLNYLMILSPNIPNKYIPQTANFIKYRKLAKKYGLKYCAEQLKNEPLIRFDLLAQMTTHIYHLSSPKMYAFFEVYFREAKKINNYQSFYDALPKDSTRHSKYKNITSFMIDDINDNPSILIGACFLDTLKREFLVPKSKHDMISIEIYSIYDLWANSEEDKKSITHALNQYLGNCSPAISQLILKKLYVWSNIYKYIFMDEFADRDVNYLFLVIKSLPEAYIPEHSFSIQVYRGRKDDGVGALDDEVLTRLAILVDMTSFVYDLSDNKRLRFFEEYYKKAKKR